MRMRLEWKVKGPSSGRMRWRAAKIAGISVSIVVLELGTIWPIRIDSRMAVYRDSIRRGGVERPFVCDRLPVMEHVRAATKDVAELSKQGYFTILLDESLRGLVAALE